MNEEKRDPEDSESTLSKTYRELAPYLGLGIQFALSLTLCILIGYWLDQNYGTAPLYTLIGVFLGMFAGFYNLFKVVSRMDKKNETDKKSK